MISGLAFSPALTLADEHLDLVTDAMRGALDAVR
jgi:hypothetical protein